MNKRYIQQDNSITNLIKSAFPSTIFENKLILDFGGNKGNLLKFSNEEILPENYYCIDTHLPALEEGRKEFPKAHWINNNSYNFHYNKTGNKLTTFKDLDLPLFDMIVCINVLFHMRCFEIEHYFKELYNQLKPGGQFFISFFDINYGLPHTLINQQKIDNPDLSFIEDKNFVYTHCTDDKRYQFSFEEEENLDSGFSFLSFFKPKYLIEDILKIPESSNYRMVILDRKKSRHQNLLLIEK